MPNSQKQPQYLIATVCFHMLTILIFQSFTRVGLILFALRQNKEPPNLSMRMSLNGAIHFTVIFIYIVNCDRRANQFLSHPLIYIFFTNTKK